MFKSNRRWLRWEIIAIAVIVVGAGLRLYYDQRDAQLARMGNQERFKTEYPHVTGNNPFIYVSGEEAVRILREGTGLVMLGFPECPWCQGVAPRIELAAEAEGIDKVYYYNILEARKNNDEIYTQLVDTLREHLRKDEDGNPRIGAPDITAVKQGKIVGRFEHEGFGENETVSPENYWSNQARAERSDKQLRDILRKTKD